MFKRLSIHGWRQYGDIDLEFHPRLTVLTGANGCGKTTILNVLNRHFGWSITFLSTPKKRKKDGILEFFPGLWEKLFLKNDSEDTKEVMVGEITYDDDSVALLKIPTNVHKEYQFNIEGKKLVPGLHIPSHRPTFVHQEVDSLPTTPPTRSAIFRTYSDEIKNRHITGYSDRHAPNYHLKEALISLAVYGYGNEVVEANQEARELFEGFQDVLTKVLPPKLGFKKLLIEMPEVVMSTRSGDFPVDAASGGITAIIDLAWQIYTFSKQGEIKGNPFVVTLDEPENHLHPEMQRALLKNFIDAFPDAQFIVATHNPFIVTSVPDSNVYVLDYETIDSESSQKRVNSFLLDNVEKAGSSNEILREVLGLDSTIPLWAEEKLNEIVSRYSSQILEESTLREFRSEMKEIGFDKYIPETLSKVSLEHDKTD